MAKIEEGYLGGFSGRLGPAIGYKWNGRWCVRSYQRFVHNPRTRLQQAHRGMFKAEVQLASTMRWAVTAMLTDEARQLGMTAYNLFVHLNQGAFSLVDNEFTVDWSRLQLTAGRYVCGVNFGRAEWSADNVLTVPFESRSRHSQYGRVSLYVYCPATATGFLSTPVYTRERKAAFRLPDEMAGCEVQVFAMTNAGKFGWSETVYVGGVSCCETADGEAPVEVPAVTSWPIAPVEEPVDTADMPDDADMEAPPPE